MEFKGFAADSFRRIAAPIAQQSKSLVKSLDAVELNEDREALKEAAAYLLEEMARFIKNPTESFDFKIHNQFAADVHQALSDANQSNSPIKRFSWLENSFKGLLEKTYKLYQEFNQKLFRFEYKNDARLQFLAGKPSQGFFYSLISADHLNNNERRMIKSVSSKHIEDVFELVQRSGKQTRSIFHLQNIPGQGLKFDRGNKSVENAYISFDKEPSSVDADQVINSLTNIVTAAQDEIENANPELLKKSWICSFEFLEPFSPN